MDKIRVVAFPIAILAILFALASCWEQPKDMYIQDGMLCWEVREEQTSSQYCEVLP